MSKTQVKSPHLFPHLLKSSVQPAVCPTCGQRESHKRWCPRR